VRNLVRGTQFKRDVKLAKKRGKDMAKLRYYLWKASRCLHATKTIR
jgi:mRNA-degrading endonuclease YafQ of YafQ-DinJ toxin-antitoxin module